MSGKGVFQHTFGGAHDRKGTSREDGNGILIHLLHRLDLTDRAIPISIPGVRWLPFYYCFDFRANDLGYRLISDERLVTFFPQNDPNVSDHESWPHENYPSKFPKSDIAVKAFKYDPTDLDDAYCWAGIFGIRKLSRSGRAKIKKRVAAELDGLGLGVPETEQEFDDALCSPFVQGKPNRNCLNPTCGNFKRKGQLSTIGLMPAEPVKGVHTFGSLGGGVELIFQMCKECQTIRVSNQCD